MATGELAEAEIYLKRCTEIEPESESHKEELRSIRELIVDYEELNKAKFTKDYKKCETLSYKLLQKCTDNQSIKLIYIESSLNNCKIQQALDFLKNKLSDDEKRNEEFEYLLCNAYYYDGK
jgi:hypothetical protein